MQTEQKTHTTTFAIFDDLKRNTQQVVFDLKRTIFLGFALWNIPHLSKSFYDFFSSLAVKRAADKILTLLVRFGKERARPPNVIYGVHKVSIVTPRARSQPRNAVDDEE